MVIKHDFTWHKIAWLVVAIIGIFSIRWGAIIVPQVRQTADKVASLNNLQTLDIHGKIGGCIPIDIKGLV